MEALLEQVVYEALARTWYHSDTKPRKSKHMAMGSMSMLWLLMAFQMVTMVKAGDETTLLAFKAQASVGGSRTLAFWNSSAHFCSWEGVTCSRRRPTTRVIALSLWMAMGTRYPLTRRVPVLNGEGMVAIWTHGSA